MFKSDCVDALGFALHSMFNENIATREVITEKWPSKTTLINCKTGELQISTKKLRAIWTPKLVQDLIAFQAIDTEVELTILSNDFKF